MQGGATNSGTLATEMPQINVPHEARWRPRTLQSDGVQALTMRDLRTYYVDIVCHSEVRIQRELLFSD